MRIPHPNTSININFPMYMPPGMPHGLPSGYPPYNYPPGQNLAQQSRYNQPLTNQREQINQFQTSLPNSLNNSLPGDNNLNQINNATSVINSTSFSNHANTNYRPQSGSSTNLLPYA
jgi:hypothetical protein